MDTDALKKMTVAELREEAKKIPDVTGISSMKKDDLVALIAGQGGGEAAAPAAATAPTPAKASKKPAAVAMPTGKPETKTEIKQMIKALKAQKQEALSGQDNTKAKECNRRIHKYKRALRKAARTA
jgi:hypothetical protein